MTSLGHTVLRPSSGSASAHLYFLHGILGTRANWRGIARRVLSARPGLGAVLVDLREHGDSLGLEGPDTLAQAAEDVAALGRALGLPVDGLVGHSFGGKVALAYAQAFGALSELWVVDSSPSALRSNSLPAGESAAVLEVLGRVPRRYPDREAFLERLGAEGLSAPVAQWLAMNLRREADGGRVFGPDLARIRALLASYARTDLFGVLDPPPCPTGFLVGERSDVVSAADRARLEALAAKHEALHVYPIAGAGHWVHVDAPDAVVALLSEPPGAASR
jgi:pimeloyl-ACP methyl ester carboxylesterase